MEIVTTFNFLAIFIAFVGRITRKEKACFLFAIIMLTIFYSIRTDYGNDLPAYIQIFETISRMSPSHLIDSKERLESGWIILNYLFRNLDWQWLLAMLTIFQFTSIYIFITRYVPSQKYWIIFGIYLLSSDLFLTSLSMLRQALAMHILLFAIPFILKRQLVQSFLIILLASTFHSSAIVSMLLIGLPFISNVKPQIGLAIFIVLLTVFFIADNLVADILKNMLKTESFERYDIYSEDKAERGLGLFNMLRTFIAIWLLIKYSADRESIIFNLCYCIYVLIIPFALSIPLIGRIGNYFCLESIVAYKNFTSLKSDPIGFTMLMAFLFVMIMQYFAFFENPVWIDAFSEYSTIFD